VHVCHRYIHIHSDHKELRLMIVDTPYETVEEAQNWWKTVDLPADQKEAVARKCRYLDVDLTSCKIASIIRIQESANLK
jgi:hypothetical protein